MIRSALVSAWNRRAPEEVAGLYTADGVRRVMTDPPTVLRGRAEIAEYVSGVFDRFPDAVLDLRSDGISSGGLVIVEWTLRTDSPAPGSGRPAPRTTHGVSLLVMDGPSILEERVYPAAGRHPG